ncbi:MAG: aminotransferase class IV [Balneolales bacterium]
MAVFNDKIIPIPETRVSVSSRLAMYGEGCFDTFRTYNGGLLYPEAHLERLHRGIHLLGIKRPRRLRDAKSFSLLVRSFLDANEAMEKDVRVRIQVWADDYTPGYFPGNHPDQRAACYLISGIPITEDPPGMNESTELPSGVSMITSRFRRIPTNALPCDVKWTNGINYILAAQEARQKNVDDALMLTQDGFVSETTIANVFWKNGDVVFTPSPDCDLLPGITRHFLILVLKDIGITIQTGRYKPGELKKSDMIWACNSVRELYPVTWLDQQHFPVDPSFWTMMCDHFQNMKKKSMKDVR